MLLDEYVMGGPRHKSMESINALRRRFHSIQTSILVPTSSITRSRQKDNPRTKLLSKSSDSASSSRLASFGLEIREKDITQKNSQGKHFSRPH